MTGVIGLDNVGVGDIDGVDSYITNMGVPGLSFVAIRNYDVDSVDRRLAEIDFIGNKKHGNRSNTMSKSM